MSSPTLSDFRDSAAGVSVAIRFWRCLGLKGCQGGWEDGVQTVLVLPLFLGMEAKRANQDAIWSCDKAIRRCVLLGRTDEPSAFLGLSGCRCSFWEGHHYLDNLGLACLPKRRSTAEPGLSRGSRLSLRPFRYGHQSCTTNARTTNPRMLIDIYVKRGQCERERTLTQRLQDPKHSFDLAQMSGMPFPKTNAEHRHVEKEKKLRGISRPALLHGGPHQGLRASAAAERFGAHLREAPGDFRHPKLLLSGEIE